MDESIHDYQIEYSWILLYELIFKQEQAMDLAKQASDNHTKN